MVKSIRAIWRQFAADRRQAKRFRTAREVRLIVGVAFGGADHFTSIIGRTRDISTSGLAISLPISNPQHQELLRVGVTVRLLLMLPSKTLSMNAALIRSEPLDDDELGTGQLVAVRITEMQPDDKSYYHEFLNGL